MPSPLRIEVEKMKTTQINTQIKADILEEFQRKLKTQNIPMYLTLEVFMRQYAKGDYHLKTTDILRYSNYYATNCDTGTLSTPVNKVIYEHFKSKVKANKLCIKHVLSAFIEEYIMNDLTMEFTRTEK